MVYIIASIEGKGVLESDFLDAFFASKTSIYITKKASEPGKVP